MSGPRSLMFVPANRADMLTKAPSYGAESLIFDIEDSVPIAEKPKARITNDAWFGRTPAPYQHFSMAVFRAVEDRVPVARAANTGVSGFIDAKGRVLGATEIFREAHDTEELVVGGPRTFYTEWGDLFAYLCCFATLAMFIAAKVVERRGRSRQQRKSGAM